MASRSRVTVRNRRVAFVGRWCAPPTKTVATTIACPTSTPLTRSTIASIRASYEGDRGADGSAQTLLCVLPSRDEGATNGDPLTRRGSGFTAWSWAAKETRPSRGRLRGDYRDGGSARRRLFMLGGAPQRRGVALQLASLGAKGGTTMGPYSFTQAGEFF